ncbi:hypothetical protein FBU30_001180, partial [Linnemannia zychae]
MLQDVFSQLFSILYDRLEGLKIFESSLRPIIRDEFLSIREKLIARAYPNFSGESRLRLVMDEAQILSDKCSTKFYSSYLETDPQPMLSPVLYSFRNAGSPKEFTIVYCGTELSVKTLHWTLSSGDGVKEYGSRNFPCKLVLPGRQFFQIPLGPRMEPLVHEILASPVRKKALHHHRKSKVSELDMAIAGVFRMVYHVCEDVPMSDRKVLFAFGNGAFRSNINFSSVHTTFLGRLLQK